MQFSNMSKNLNYLLFLSKCYLHVSHIKYKYCIITEGNSKARNKISHTKVDAQCYCMKFFR